MKQMSYITRWLYSTSHKDIAILYLAYGLISSMVATGMSVIIRMELSGPNPQYLNGNNQVFNVLVTGHAIAMIFLFVMPVLIGAFGELKILILPPLKGSGIPSLWRGIFKLEYLYLLFKQEKDNNKINSIINEVNLFKENNKSLKKEYNDLDRDFIGPYLAGLIEGNGSIFINEGKYKNSTSPLIDIIFPEKDYNLVIYLQNKLNLGIIKINKNAKVYIWHIKKIKDIYTLLELTNGYYRTPKYETVNRVINWINNFIVTAQEANISLHSNKIEHNLKHIFKYDIKTIKNILSSIDIISIKPLNESDLWSNSWLAGFTDANGNFNISINKRKNNKINILLSYKLEIRQNYNIKLYENINNNPLSSSSKYYEIMINIANIFNSNLNIRKIKLENKESYSYIIDVININNLKLVDNYFNKFSLLSSKYIDFKDWSKILNLAIFKRNKLSDPECILLANKTINNYNKTRTIFNWNHLK